MQTKKNQRRIAAMIPLEKQFSARSVKSKSLSITTRSFAAAAIGFALYLASHGHALAQASAQTPPFQWAKRVASTINDDDELTIGLAIDSAANLYVTGWFDGTNDFGGVILTNTPGGGQDIFVAKYNSSGTLLWARQAGSSLPGWDAGRGIGVDDAGNVYVTGQFVGYANFDGIVLSGGTEQRFFLAKYGNEGTIQWVRQSAGTQDHYGTGLAVDGAGNCHAVGYIDSRATMAFDANVSLTNTNISGYSAFLVKYDSDGNVLWARLLDSPARCYSSSVALDASGHVYVPGSFNASLMIGGTNLVGTNGANGFVTKFNRDGVLQWASQTSSSTNVGFGGASVDTSGSVYAVGAFGVRTGDTVTFGPSITLTNVGIGVSRATGDAFLAKYDGATGTAQWAVRAGGTNADVFFGVTTDSQGHVYVSGGSGGTGILNGFNAVVAEYDTNGMVQWTQSSIGTNGALVFAGPVVDTAGNCYVAGWFQTNAVFGATTLTGSGYWDVFLAKVGFAPLTLGVVWSNAMPWLSVSGETGNRFALESVPALAAGNSWRGLITNTLGGSPMWYADTNSAGNPTRFYRARLAP